jgi:tRNA-dihydrouridine synthase B
MKIGNLLLENRTVLAPMAGVNCTSFRIMCKKHGAGLLFTQMYSVKRIVEKGSALFDIRKEEFPVAIQLIGKLTDPWEDAVEIAERYADLIDINLGCIESDFLGEKSGCYLMQHPDQVAKIAKKVVAFTAKPVTAKIRSGWDNKFINAVEIAKVLEHEGISAITVHPRTRKQQYMGKADWNIIKQVKQSISIPVIGNGDITLPGHAKAMVEQTKCDAVMIGRAARDNPYIFDDINYLLETGKNRGEIIKSSRFLIKEFIELYEKYEKNQSLNQFKDHCMWFVKGHPDAAAIKQRIKDANSIACIKRQMGLKDA